MFSVRMFPLIALVAIFSVLGLPLFSYAQSATTTAPINVEAKVRAYFADIPIMSEIAKCESKFTQFNKDGSVLHGGTAHGMIGVFQINKSVHAITSRLMGMDINTIDGNLAYARYLYEQHGTQPWLDSSSCWGSFVNKATQATSSLATTVDEPMHYTQEQLEQIGNLQQQIVSLQQILAVLFKQRNT